MPLGKGKQAELQPLTLLLNFSIILGEEKEILGVYFHLLFDKLLSFVCEMGTQASQMHSETTCN